MVRMMRDRAVRRSLGFMKDECEVVEPSNTPDGYGGWSSDNEGTILYSGRCFASPGNMWPFEIPEAAVRQGRGDLLFYLPRQVDGLSIESVIHYNNEEFEVIGYANATTAGAGLIVTGRRVRQ